MNNKHEPIIPVEDNGLLSLLKNVILRDLKEFCLVCFQSSNVDDNDAP